MSSIKLGFFRIILFIILVAVFSCKTTTSSLLEKDHIQVKTKPRYVPFLIARQGEYIGAPWESKFKGSTPKTIRFLEELLAHLADANPDFFKGWYDPDKFFFGINSQAFYMDTNSRFSFISVSPNALLESSEVELLGVLAHEVAHITQRDKEMLRSHAGLEALPTYAQKYQKLYHQQWLHWKKIEEQDWRFVDSLSSSSRNFPTNLASAYQDLRKATWQRFYETSMYAGEDPGIRESLMKPLHQDSKGLTSFLDGLKVWDANLASQYTSPKVPAMLQEILKEKTKMAESAAKELGFSDAEDFEKNYMEERADNIGLLLFVNAGYSPEQYVALFKRKLGGELNECLLEIKRGQVPPRIQKKTSHPSLCYRIYNISVIQSKSLSQKFVDRKHKSVQTSVSLQQVRDEIQKIVDDN